MEKNESNVGLTDIGFFVFKNSFCIFAIEIKNIKL